MDFSAFNPLASNALNMAARNNEIVHLERLLRKNNPNCVDNRGWTCLHEAAANDRYECVKMILNHPDCRPLAETFEGHTALYLACRNKCSLDCIKLLLDNVEDIAQYASTEMVSPLHLACMKGNTELVELLLRYNSIINLQDFDGDTPLHDAAFATKDEAVSILLHAGAEPEMRNVMGYTPFHMACMQGCMRSVLHLHPFVTNINKATNVRDTPLILASLKGSLDIVEYLLEHGADPNLSNCVGKDALTTALIHENAQVFCILLKVTDRKRIGRDIFMMACKPHYFNFDIVVALLESDLGPEFFNVYERYPERTVEAGPALTPGYRVSSALNCFLNVADYMFTRSPEQFRQLLYLLLQRGVAVDALCPEECPPCVYLLYCDHTFCFTEVITILIGQGCNVDYKSVLLNPAPDLILAALATNSNRLSFLLQYSLAVEPDDLMRIHNGTDKLEMIMPRLQYLQSKARTRLYRRRYSKAIGLVTRVIGCPEVKEKNFNATDMLRNITNHTGAEKMSSSPVQALQHLCRLKIRKLLRDRGIKTTRDYLECLNMLPLPKTLSDFIRYAR